MFFYSSKVLNLVFVTAIVNAIDLTHDISDTKPIVYKILERNNRIIVQKDNNGIGVANGNDLKKFLNQNADLEYNIKNILKANKPFKGGQKRRLVKKIVPHGVDTSDGSRYFKSVGTYFKPLIKLHKTKKLESYPDANRDSSDREDPLVSFRNDAIPKLDQVQAQLESMNKYRSDVLNVKTADDDFGTKLPSETEHTMQHLTEMERLASIMTNPMLKEIVRSKMSALRAQTEEVHSAIIDLMSIAGKFSTGGLRNNVEYAEDSDEVVSTQKIFHLAPGVDMTLAPDTKPTELQCALFPHQPLWGYWQHKQTIYQDDCKEGQLIGNVCSKLHPHK